MSALLNIEKLIFHLRDHKVMTDSDLASLYKVETKVLLQSVRRNLERFPEDFMFECDSMELEDLRSQFVTANRSTDWNHKRRGSVYVFTDYGIAMLSSVLKSELAIQMNIAIMRAFTRIRKTPSQDSKILQRVSALEEGTKKVFEIVFERLDSLESEVPILKPQRRKIGLKNVEKDSKLAAR